MYTCLYYKEVKTRLVFHNSLFACVHYTQCDCVVVFIHKRLTFNQAYCFHDIGSVPASLWLVITMGIESYSRAGVVVE